MQHETDMRVYIYIHIMYMGCMSVTDNNACITRQHHVCTVYDMAIQVVIIIIKCVREL